MPYSKQPKATRQGGSVAQKVVHFEASHFDHRWYILTDRRHYTDRFEDPNLPGEMHITVELKEVFCGTELNITQEGVPAVIPAPACYMGWQESLTLLGQLVEAEIPDQG